METKIDGEIMEADEGKVMTSTKWKPPDSDNTAGQGDPRVDSFCSSAGKVQKEQAPAVLRGTRVPALQGVDSKVPADTCSE